MKRAFTLVELAIVLVIIGLLVGGVLVGVDLIRLASIRSQVSDIDKVNAAVNTFQTKYRCIPGDCRFAVNYLTGVRNGNGDGQIDAMSGASGQTPFWASNGNTKWLDWGYTSGIFRGEYSEVFNHLSVAGLSELGTYDTTTNATNIPGTGYPALKMSSANGGGGMVVGYEAGYLYIQAGHRIRLGACPSGSYVVFSCGPSPPDARALDEKIDDSFPYTGSVVITGEEGVYTGRIPTTTSGDETDGCGTYATNSYRTTRNGNHYFACAMDIKASF